MDLAVNKVKKILIISKDISQGGVQRALISLLVNIQSEYFIDLYLIDDTRKELEDEIPEKVNIIKTRQLINKYTYFDITHRNKLRCSGKLCKAVIRLIRKVGLEETLAKILSRGLFTNKYDCVISFTGMPGIWDCIAKSIPARKITYIHNDPLVLGIKSLNIRHYYRKFDAIICVSKEIKRLMLELCPQCTEKFHVVYNYLDVRHIDKCIYEAKNPYVANTINIVTVARLLNESKRIDRIIETVQILLSKSFPNFIWHIVGSGPDEELIKDWILSSGTYNNIILHGFQKNPFPFIKFADLFVLTSDYEGLPVTFMESLYLKTPVISTNLPCAIEIIRNDINGYIAEKDAMSIANRIIYYFDTNGTREGININLKNTSYDYYLLGERITSIIERFTSGE